jgi:hypothetical protein
LKYFLETILVRQALSHSFGTKGMAAGPPNLKYFKKNFRKKWKYFLETFQVWWARSHSFGTKAMAAGLPNLECS